MVIRDVTIRRGTAHLKPSCIVFKGHQTADRDERREAIFLRGLKLRLGYVPGTLSLHARILTRLLREEVPDDEPAPEPAPAPPIRTQLPTNAKLILSAPAELLHFDYAEDAFASQAMVNALIFVNPRKDFDCACSTGCSTLFSPRFPQIIL